MSLYAFVIVWVVHGTLLGLIAVAMPALLRMRHPASLARWWASAAMAVVALPLLPLALPPAAGPSAIGVAFADSTEALANAGAGAGARPSTFSPVVVLGLSWAIGAGARLLWLLSGHRRLRALVASAREVTDDPALAEARALAPRAVFPPFAASRVPVYASADGGPCAFGWLGVGVLVPDSLRSRPAEERAAVYLHEIVHVGRGDTGRGYADEVWRLLWWWHPAVWWLLARLRLAREQEVDAIVVARTGHVRSYVEALLWCSSLRPMRPPSLAIRGTRHALVQRVVAMTKGGTMSRKRRWTTEMASAATFALVVGVSGAYSPLRGAPVGQEATSPVAGPGPLERAAVMPTLDVPAPRRIETVEPEWSGRQWGRLRVHLVVDAQGSVAEARVVFPPAMHGQHADAQEFPQAVEAVLAAVRQWRFEVPGAAPMLLATDVWLGPARQAVAQAAGTERQTSSGAAPLRVGGTIRPPSKVLDVPPIYPQVARDARVQGVVIIEATVASNGLVSDARLLRSIPLLDQAALDAVKQWRYEPTRLNGEAVPVVMVVTVNFTLQ